MPMYNDLQWKKVPVGNSGTPAYTYVFQTKVLTGVSTDLGHTNVIGTNGIYTLAQGEIVGANIPKPTVLGKKGVAGGTSFVDPAKIGTALAGGYVRRAKAKIGLRRGAQVQPTGRGSSIAVACRTSTGVLFAWRMPGEQYVKISSDLAGLGITELSSNADWENAVFGATLPRPPRARKVIDNGVDGEDIIETFCGASVSDSLPTGWRLVKGEQLIIQV